MTEPHLPEDSLTNSGQAEIMSALFNRLVVQQGNMALMFLGRIPHPETGGDVRDVESAKVYIDQLEMLAFKSRGNLTTEEDELIRKSLSVLQKAFVEELEKPDDSSRAG